MFTQRQIAVAGFISVYAGCAVLTINLARIPYRRGAYIGVAFGALMHIVVTFLYIIIALTVGAWMDDPILKQNSTWLVTAFFAFVIQILSAVGCTIMGRYFLAPASRHDTFDRNKLYQMLKQKDTGKRSVLHDVVTIIEKTETPQVRHFSSFWIVLLGILSIMAIVYWLYTLTISCLNVIFLGVTVNAEWWLLIAGQFCIPLIVLIVTNIAMISWLNRN